MPMPASVHVVLSVLLATAPASPESAPPLSEAIPAPAATGWLLGWNSKRDGNWEIYVRDASGADRNLTRRESAEWAWGTRGDDLLVLANAAESGEPKGWRACRLGPGSLARLGDTVVGDGLFDCHPGVGGCLVQVREGSQRRIARFDDRGRRLGLLPNPVAASDDADPQLSPDGTRLLFRSSRSGSWELWLADADGANARVLTDESGNDNVPDHAYGGEGPARFSPDGRRITWMREMEKDGADIWVMDADGSEARNLTADHAGPDGYPAFSPDGLHIAFDSKRDGDNEIYVMAADGSQVQRVTYSPGPDLAPLWIPAALARPGGAPADRPQ